MAFFDPIAVNKQIDSMLAAIPPGKHGILIGYADLASKTASVGVAFKLADSVGGYVKLSKVINGATSAEAGVHASFLFSSEEPFDRWELVEVFKARGQHWIKAHWNAWKLLNGYEVAL